MSGRRRRCNQKSLFTVLWFHDITSVPSVKPEVHVSSVCPQENGAAQSSATSVLLIVFQWCRPCHTRPQVTLEELLWDFPFFSVEELRLESCHASASSPRQEQEPVLIETAVGEEVATRDKQGDYPKSPWNCGLGLNTVREQEDTGKAGVRTKLNLTEACTWESLCTQGGLGGK